MGLYVYIYLVIERSETSKPLTFNKEILMITALYLIAFIVTLFLYQADLMSKGQLILSLIALPLLPVFLWILVTWNVIKFSYHLVFEKW